jgi:pimeloyl-ACP methyl ester carboxylesterase
MVCSVHSIDGARIGYQKFGNGVPLVLVHGTGTVGARWLPLLPLLLQHFAVYVVDRRGRGNSGDAPAYSIDLEFHDIAAVVDSIDIPVVLLGHSFGGKCSLGAACLTHNLRRLILYEPGILPPDTSYFEAGIIERLDTLCRAGKNAEVLMTFMREVLVLPETELARARVLPTWDARVAGAPTIPREMRALEYSRFEPSQYRDLPVPTMLLRGTASSAGWHPAHDLVRTTLPDCRIVEIPGQAHHAMDTAPELFVNSIVHFCESMPGENQ